MKFLSQEQKEVIAKAHGISIEAQGKSSIIWGHLSLEWLFGPPPTDLSENDASLALLISSMDQPRQRALLSGDLEAAGEKRLRRVWREGSLDVTSLTIWQINHHGSSTSTEVETVNQLHPHHAVLSLDGEHRFSFPHPSTIRTLTESGVRRHRLDIEGDVTYYFEGIERSWVENIWIAIL